MLYSIQNSFGRVYGLFEVPPTTKSPEGLAHELKGELRDIIGVNGIKDGQFRIGGAEGILHDRVVIDILPPSHLGEDEVLNRIHETVGRVAMSGTVDLGE